ncbi:MAG: DNA helicase RecQ [Muribaculaceae bacterium]|nr:DNA helicase RecQ [Muribaculaceae bacterium]
MNKYEILKKYFGYSTFREGQEILIDNILAGKDVLGIMPTGAGKSICYQAPALLLPGITLVISPLISLMKDQVQALNQAGIHAAYINSSLSEAQIAKALRLAAGGQYKIIYVAPERLESYDFLAFTERVEISMLTIDEAHCISQWGQDFRPSYLKIVQFIKRLKARPIVSAFTATATDKVKEDIVASLALQNPRILITGFDRKNLYFAVETPRKKDTYVRNYIREHALESGIIYCATRKNVDTLYEKLSEEGISVTRYHAGLSAEERKQNQEDFIYDNKPIMIATNAFGMGIDKSNVRYVIHYNMPQSLENYYQEAGRAGRDGEKASCILLYSAQDIMINRFLLDNKEPAADMTDMDAAAVRERDEERLRAMTGYCTTTSCLRAYILRYFGETGEDSCSNCLNCLREYEEIDRTEAAKSIISCIQALGQRYGINVIAGTLAGSRRAKLQEYGVYSYSCYGALEDMTEAEIKQLIQQMILDKLLFQTNDKYALLKTPPGAFQVLSGDRRVILKHFKTTDDVPVDDSSSSAESYQAASATKKKKSSGKARRSDLLNSRGLELFEQLRELRTDIAKEEQMPPYIIFADKTLVDMCVKCPFTKSEMLQVIGVGENKFTRYGERFLGVIREYTGGVWEKFYFGEEEDL